MVASGHGCHEDRNVRRAKLAAAVLGVAVACALDAAPAASRDVRVCAGADAMPSVPAPSSDLRMANVVAWSPNALAHLRSMRDRGRCDVVVRLPGAAVRPADGFSPVAGASASVYRARWLRRLDSLDDPRLRALRIGVAVAGDDPGVPRADVLARRGIVARVIDFSGDDERPIAARMREALDEGRLDVAVLWRRAEPAGYGVAHALRAFQIAPMEDAKPNGEGTATGRQRRPASAFHAIFR